MDWRKGGCNSHIAYLGKNLSYHPHLHFIVPAGALMANGRWKHARNRGKYLFKVTQLSDVFRARLVEEARKLSEDREITGVVPGGLFDTDWVIYAKRPFGGPVQVINYLGRYTHRAAISNERIINVNEQKVSFTWKDYRNNYAKQTTTLTGEDFMRLFCMHILPPGFTRIRHYGFLSSASKRKSLAIIRTDLKANPPSVSTTKTWQDRIFEKMGIKPGVCKCCGGEMIVIESFTNQFRARQRAPPKLDSDIKVQ